MDEYQTYSSVLDSINEEIRRVPFVRIFIPFLAGVATASSIYLSFYFSLASTLFIFLTVLFFWLRRKISYKYNLRWVFGLTVYLFLFFGGYSYYNAFRSLPGLREPGDETLAFVGDVYEIPEERNKSVRILLKLRAGLMTDTVVAESGRVLVYLEKDSLSMGIRLGDRLFLENNFRPVKPPGNPNEFNYRKYLQNQRIYCQAYIRHGQWKIIERERGNPFILFAGRVRENLLFLFEKYGLEGEEYAVASALILGYRGALEQQTRRSYSASGAMHVLAVSGLHVGIIYLILNFFMGLLSLIPRGREIRAILLLVSIWFYALLTGLSPSVMRAATMFSFLIIGSALNRPPNIYNTLAASAFFLILTDPFIIHAVGFQLSYLAVTGIVFFQPRFYKLLYIRNKVLDKIWALACVSIGAQLGTFPLTVYYFQQFPNYFLITNLFVIPLAGVILLTGILLFAFSFWHPLAWFFSLLLEWSVRGLNEVVKVIEWLPFSHTQGIFLHHLQLPLVYMMLIIFTVFLIRRRPVWLIAGLTALLVSASFRAWLRIDSSLKNQLIVYDSGDHLILNFLGGGENLVITDADPELIKDQIYFIAGGHWTRFFLKEPTFFDSGNESLTIRQVGREVSNHRHFWSFAGKTILLPDKTFLQSVPPDSPGFVDYLVLSGSTFLSPGELLKFVEPGLVIVSSSVPPWQGRRYDEEYAETGIACHRVTESGAFQDVYK